MLARAPTWVNSEYIVPSEKRQTRRPHIPYLQLWEMLGTDKSVKTKSRLVVPRGSGKGGLGE